MSTHPSCRRRGLAPALVVAATLLASCGSAPVTTSQSRAGGTLVTYTGVPSCTSTVETALVTQDPRGCFQLDGDPVAFPAGTRWADGSGRTVRLPDGQQLRDGAVVSGAVCTGTPMPEWAGYECGVGRDDPVVGLVGGVSVQPVLP